MEPKKEIFIQRVMHYIIELPGEASGWDDIDAHLEFFEDEEGNAYCDVWLQSFTPGDWPFRHFVFCMPLPEEYSFENIEDGLELIAATVLETEEFLDAVQDMAEFMAEEYRKFAAEAPQGPVS